MSSKVIQSADVAAQFIKEIKSTLLKSQISPVLVGFLANEDPAAKKYAEWTSKSCQETGIRFELRECKRLELEDKIIEANQDDKVHGIMVYYPVFGGSQDLYLQSTIDYRKDVEGLCHKYRYNMYHNIRFLDSDKTQKCIIPCTPLAIVKILEYIGAYNKVLEDGNGLHGKTVTVLNRSEHVGRPLAALLANDGAKVYSVDEFGILEFHRGAGIQLRRHEIFESNVSLDEALKYSDIVIGGVPSKGYKIPTSKLKEGVIALNFASFKNFEEDITSKASIHVPSVGKVTVAMLQRNLLRLYSYQMSSFQ